MNLENPANGNVTLRGNSVGDTAAFTCNPGFQLIGISVLTCQNDGTWNDSLPTCIEIGKRQTTLLIIHCDTCIILSYPCSD